MSFSYLWGGWGVFCFIVMKDLNLITVGYINSKTGLWPISNKYENQIENHQHIILLYFVHVSVHVFIVQHTR